MNDLRGRHFKMEADTDLQHQISMATATPDGNPVFVLAHDSINTQLFYFCMMEEIYDQNVTEKNLQNCIFIGHQNQVLSKKIQFETQHSIIQPLNSLVRFVFSTCSTE